MAAGRKSGRFMARAPRRRSFLRRTTRRARGLVARVQRRTRSIGSGIPSWAKPSRITAYTGVAAGIGTLVVTPLPNGDSWMARLGKGYESYLVTKNPMDLLSWDSGGNNTATIAVAQLKANAVPAIGTVVGFGIAAAILKRFGM